jgi:hypothetical protein
VDGKLVKLQIEAFRDVECQSRIGEPFVVQFNPASYTSSYAVVYDRKQGAGTSATSKPFDHIKPQDHTLELIFDGTGTASEPREVHEDVQQFLRTTCKYDGSVHRPPYLRLSWGTLIIQCVMKSADITYTLFKPNGHPLRAKVKAVFTVALDETLRKNMENRQSPDMTHRRVVQGGDTLPLMVHRVYRSTANTVDVARFNGLSHLRDLRAGQVLHLPPLVQAP